MQREHHLPMNWFVYDLRPNSQIKKSDAKES